MDRMALLLQAPKKVLVTHAVLLLRTVNKYETKEQQLYTYDRYCTKEMLADYIVHFHDPITEKWDQSDSLCENRHEHEYRSASAGDYGPSHPWDAPGMSVRDFI